MRLSLFLHQRAEWKHTQGSVSNSFCREHLSSELCDCKRSKFAAATAVETRRQETDSTSSGVTAGKPTVVHFNWHETALFISIN